MEDNRFDATGHLNRADGVWSVHDVGRIAACTEWRRPILELQLGPLIAEARPIRKSGVRRQSVPRNVLPTGRRQAVIEQTHHHSNLPVIRVSRPEVIRYRAPGS